VAAAAPAPATVAAEFSSAHSQENMDPPGDSPFARALQEEEEAREAELAQGLARVAIRDMRGRQDFPAHEDDVGFRVPRRKLTGKEKFPVWAPGTGFRTFQTLFRVFCDGLGVLELLSVPHDAADASSTLDHAMLRSYLLQAIPVREVQPMYETKSVCDIWRDIVARNERSAKEELRTLRPKFYTSSQSGRRMREHVSNVTALADRLRQLGCVISEEDERDRLLATDIQYVYLQPTLAGLPLELVKQQLIDAEAYFDEDRQNRRQRQSAGNSRGPPLVAGIRGDRSNQQCNGCKQYGHFEYECPDA
jgi:hypothetical protein